MSSQSLIVPLPESPETRVTFLTLPWLKLYVISDAKGFGATWIQVTYNRKMYDTELLLGNNPNESISSMARFLSESVINKMLANSPDELLAVDEIKLIFSISLRNSDPKIVRFIKQEFNKLLAS